MENKSKEFINSPIFDSAKYQQILKIISESASANVHSAKAAQESYSSWQKILSDASLYINSKNYSALTNALPSSTPQVTRRKQYFLSQKINIDGIIFEECRFDECVLFSEKGNIKLNNCVIGPGTTISLGKDLVAIAKLITLQQSIPADWKPTFKQVGNLTTVSIP